MSFQLQLLRKNLEAANASAAKVKAMTSATALKIAIEAERRSR